MPITLIQEYPATTPGAATQIKMDPPPRGGKAKLRHRKTSTLRQSRQRHFLLNSGSLDDRINKIRRDIVQGFAFAVRPANAHFLHLLIRRQPEVQPQIVLRNVAGAEI